MSRLNNSNGEVFRHQQDKPPMDLRYARDSEKRINGVVNATKRAWSMFQDGVISLTDFNIGLEANAANIGISPEELNEKVQSSISEQTNISGPEGKE